MVVAASEYVRLTFELARSSPTGMPPSLRVLSLILFQYAFLAGQTRSGDAPRNPRRLIRLGRRSARKALAMKGAAWPPHLSIEVLAGDAAEAEEMPGH